MESYLPVFIGSLLVLLGFCVFFFNFTFCFVLFSLFWDHLKFPVLPNSKHSHSDHRLFFTFDYVGCFLMGE